MTNREVIEVALSARNETALFADGFDDAIVGLVEHFGPEGRVLLVLYDYDKCLHVLRTRDGMTFEDAQEFFEFNVLDAYVGTRTPAFVRRIEVLREEL